MIGTVNMNMLTLDVTEIEDIRKGSEVVFIGNQGEQRISVASFGEMSSQLNYELLCSLRYILYTSYRSGFTLDSFLTLLIVL